MDTGHTGNHPSAVSAAALVAEARKHLGIPYAHQGRSAGGLDCIGFPLLLMVKLGLAPEIIGRADYGKMPQGELLEAVETYMQRIDVFKPGAMLLMQWPRTRYPSHCGIGAAHPKMGPMIIHAYGGAGSVVEHVFTGLWPKMLHSIWAFDGVSYE